MLTATKTSLFSRQIEVFDDGRPVASWFPSVWLSGGDVTVDGAPYRVRSGILSSAFRLEDAAGLVVATAHRAGRKHWSIEAPDGTVYEFGRASMWTTQVDLLAGCQRIGYVQKAGFWRTGASAELPGLPLPLQVFAVAVILTVWARNASAAAGGTAAAAGGAASG